MKAISQLSSSKKIEWILRIAVAGEFLGHGMFALQGKEGWFKYFYPFGITDPQTIVSILFLIGLLDLVLVVFVLVRPVKVLLLWMAFWGLWTALLRWPIEIGRASCRERV